MNSGHKLLLILIAAGAPLAAQTLTNATLNGKYFVRHVQFTTDASNTVTDARSITGTVTFDGSGGYAFNGQQVVGAGAAAAYSSSGTYSLAASGVVTLTNPQKASLTVNARYSAEAVAGSSTEAPTGTVDLLIAIPAPKTTVTNATLTGTYYAADFELPAASMSQVRNAWVSMVADGAGNLGAVNVAGHAANVQGAQQLIQSVTGATYAMKSDGTGTATFPFPAGGSLQTALLNGAQRTVQISASGNVFLGATAAGHDIVVALKSFTGTATAASIAPSMWFAGLRADPQSGAASFVGTRRAARMMVYTRRLNLAGYTNAIYDTSALPYTVAQDGSGSMNSAKIGLGAGGTVMINATVDLTLDPTGYEIGFAMAAPQLSGSGVYINPLGIVNTASFAPGIGAISPGEFIAIYGSDLAAAQTAAAAPYPTNGVGGVTVTIGGIPAAVYFVSAGQVNCIVPYGVTGATADIVVTNNGTKSNTVTLPVATTTPGIFTLDSSGLNDGSILHADNTVVNPGSPAIKGEVIQMFVSGLGAVTNAIKDGAGATAANAAKTSIQVLIDGIPATVFYAGMTTYPGLYQINVQIPKTLAFSGELPIAIVTPDAYNDMASIAVQ